MRQGGRCSDKQVRNICHLRSGLKGEGEQKNPHFPDLRSFQVTFETQLKGQPLCRAPTAPAMLTRAKISQTIPQQSFSQYPANILVQAQTALRASQHQKSCQINMYIKKCWAPSYLACLPYSRHSLLGCSPVGALGLGLSAAGASKGLLQLVRINITLLPLMELQSLPAAVTSLQQCNMLKRSFDFQTCCSMRPEPAVTGRLSHGHGSLPGLPVNWQVFHSCGNSTFDICVLLQWKFCIWGPVCARILVIRQILLHFCYCYIISWITFFFSKEISYYFILNFLKGLFKNKLT